MVNTSTTKRAIQCFVALGILTLAACADEAQDAGDAAESSDAEETITLSAGTEATEGSLYYEQLAFLEEKMPERTDGRVEVDIFPDEQMGSESSMMEGVRSGSLDLAIVGGANFAALVEEFQLFSSPYLFQNEEHYRAGMEPESPLWKELASTVEDEYDLGIKLAAPATIGSRWVANSEGPVNSSEDMAELGLSIRVQDNPIEHRVWSTYGADPVNMPMPEVYSAMQQGVVQAVENSPDILENAGIHEVAPHFSATNHNFYVALLLMSEATWDSLPDDLKPAIEEVLLDSGQHVIDRAPERQADAVEILEESGAEVVLDVDVESFIDPVQGLYDDVAAESNSEHLLEIVRDLAPN